MLIRICIRNGENRKKRLFSVFPVQYLKIKNILKKQGNIFAIKNKK